MRREHRKPTGREWDATTSQWPVVRRIAPPDKVDRLGPNELGAVRIGGKPNRAYDERAA